MNCSKFFASHNPMGGRIHPVGPWPVGWQANTDKSPAAPRFLQFHLSPETPNAGAGKKGSQSTEPDLAALGIQKRRLGSFSLSLSLRVHRPDRGGACFFFPLST